MHRGEIILPPFLKFKGQRKVLEFLMISGQKVME